ncbi:DUF317 domain-containing protein [Streptomyces sp. NBC_00038]|uniref:DUF317 domain-containing protein n=1 Tax=Streptomyces sp. NBC_00038 TaxID=2903615 RepID=UPI002259099F|nr:DUF317 domain-containing protein [Streptomyces sp. NBC_00038]MCX5555329.1 DUF317 domain-containing protein [Streptomyces sp. NBC_00038]
MPNTAPDGDLYVSPLYLAGSTFTGDPALAPLLDHDFDLHSDELANVYVSSPQRHIRLGYLPEGPDYTLWKIAVHADPFGPPRWMATFDSPTPTELVTAFTTALASGYAKGPDNYLAQKAYPVDGALRPLTEAGWTRTDSWAATVCTAPDQLAGLTYSRQLPGPDAELHGDEHRWLLWGGQDGYRSRWYASFTSRTPIHLIAATTARLADPVPVLRYAPEVPARNRGTAHITPVTPPVPTPLDVRRASAARARTTIHRAVVGAAAVATAPGPSAVLPVRAFRRR